MTIKDLLGIDSFKTLVRTVFLPVIFISADAD